MDRSLRIFRWSFLAIGVGLLAIAACTSDAVGRIGVGLMGLVFGGVGGAMIFLAWNGPRRIARLVAEGRLVHATIQRVEVNEGVEVNGDCPLRIVAQWHDVQRNEVLVFRSENLWSDPGPHLEIGGTIPVHFDPANPACHHMDLSSLPRVRDAG